MSDTQYYGQYRSSTTGTSGCVKEFLTEPRPAMNYDPQISRHCELCGRAHGFRLFATLRATTPRQRAALARYATERDLETGVRV